MSSKLVLLIALLLFEGPARMAWAAETPAGQNQMVHRQGSRILDGSGRPLKLRGVNLGGWLLWEPWMWGGHLLASESKLSGRLAASAGDAETADFRKQIYDNFITEADIRRIASLGFNVIRIPFNHSILDGEGRSSNYRQSGWQTLDQVLGWAEKYQVYAILDLHSAPGGQSKLFTADPDSGGLLWDSADNKARTLGLWKAIAQRYRDSRVVAAYDLLNEPSPPNGQDLVDMYRQIVAAIREVDPSHMLLVEGAKFATDFSMFSQPLSSNQVYSFHMYTIFKDERLQQMTQYRRLSRDQNIPLWCGEFGEDSYEKIEGTLRLLEDRENGVDGWAFWPWKKVGNAKTSLLTIESPPKWKHVVEQTSAMIPLGKPRKQDALGAMKEFESAVRFENNVEDPRMISILTRWTRGGR